MRFGDETDAVIGVVRSLREAPRVTVGCMEGCCFGGRLVLLDGRDIGVFADDARIDMLEIFRGGHSRSAAPALFHARVPARHAFLPQPTGRSISEIAEAPAIGIAGHIHDPSAG